MNNYIENTSDVNDESRESAPLQIAERMPQPRVLPMPAVSDMELYLRLGVPDGLETSGEWPYKNVTASTDEHAEGQRSIRRDPSA
jgi:hypothetical protein